MATTTVAPEGTLEERTDERPSVARRLARRAQRMGTQTKRALLALVVLLIAARIAAPFIIEEYLNRRLAALEGYTGSVRDVDLALIRGAYRIEGMRILKTGGEAPVPFLSVPETDISVEWGALFDGKIVAEVTLRRPVLNFVREEQTGEEADWSSFIDDLVPLTVNRFAVHRGEVHYRDYDHRPPIDVVADRVELTAFDMSTEGGRGGPLPSRAHLGARVQRSGRLVADARFDPTADDPTFALAVRLRALDARELDPLLEKHFGVDAETGQLYLYSQVRGRGGRFEGYVKPMAHQLSVFQFGEEGDFFDQLGDFFVEIFLEIFENHGNDTLATEVPISGSFEDPEVSTWAMVVSALKNAFIEAIRHGLNDRTGWRVVGDEERRTGRAPEGERPQAASEEEDEEAREQLEELREERRERIAERRAQAEEERRAAEDRRDEG